jgi:hypothetical protein
MINPHRWRQLSLAQQLGNVGSELSRARHWESKQDDHNRDESLERALALLDLTLDDRRWRGRLRELARLREVVSDWFSGRKYYLISSSALVDYCAGFSLLSDR